MENFDNSIASGVIACLRAFRSVHDALDSIVIRERESTSLLQVSLSDNVGRFKVWAANVGAHQFARKSSLDYRLRDAPRIKNGVIQLLNELSEILLEGASTIQDFRQLSEGTDPSDLSGFESEEDNNSSHEDGSEIESLFEGLSEIITLLYRLSVTIRSSKWNNRYAKSSIDPSADTSYFEEYDIRHIQEKFRDAPKYLIERLGKANSRRRQLFKYRERHAAKLAHAIDGDGDDDDPNIAPSETMASAIYEDVVTSHIGRREVDDLQSETSYATSVGVGNSSKMPGLPKQAAEEQPFECPYCHTIEVVKNSHDWRKHVFKDLQAFVCTFPYCTTPNETYGSRREWFLHEISCHRRIWTCAGHCDRVFQSSEELTEHIRTIPSMNVTDAQIPALLEMRSSPIAKSAKLCCPICQSTVLGTSSFQKHLGRHLQDISLFALPMVENEDDIDSESTNSNLQIGGTRSHTSNMSYQSDSNSLLHAKRSLDAVDQMANMTDDEFDQSASNDYDIPGSNDIEAMEGVPEVITDLPAQVSLPQDVDRDFEDNKNAAANYYGIEKPKLITLTYNPQGGSSAASITSEESEQSTHFNSTLRNRVDGQVTETPIAVVSSPPSPSREKSEEEVLEKEQRSASLEQEMYGLEIRPLPPPSLDNSKVEEDLADSGQLMPQEKFNLNSANSPPPSSQDTSQVEEKFAELEKLMIDERAHKEGIKAREAEVAREVASIKAEEESKLREAAEKKTAEAATAAARKEAAEEAKKLKAEIEKEKREIREKVAKEKQAAEKKARDKEDRKGMEVVATAATAASTPPPPPPEKKKPIKFKDAIGRKFSFPFHLCNTWAGMEDLIRQAFLHVDVLNPRVAIILPHVTDGHYDLVGPTGEIILPQVWETMVEPDWAVTMRMWPLPESSKYNEPPEDIIPAVAVTPPPAPDSPDNHPRVKRSQRNNFSLFGPREKKAPLPKSKKTSEKPTLRSKKSSIMETPPLREGEPARIEKQGERMDEVNAPKP